MKNKSCIICGLMLFVFIFIGCKRQVNNEFINADKQVSASISQAINTIKSVNKNNNNVSIRGIDIPIDTNILYLTSTQNKTSTLTKSDIKNIEKLKKLKTVVISPDIIDEKQVDIFNDAVNDIEVKVQSEIFTQKNWRIVCKIKNVVSISNDFGGQAEIKISNLSGVENLVFLKEIYVYYEMGIIDISALGKCRNLETVVVSHEADSAIDVSALEGCSKLKYISTGFSKMEGYNKIPSSVYLDAINISAKDITDDKLKDMYLCAEKLATSSESFVKSTDGKFLNGCGETPLEFKERFEQTFTANFTDKYFELYAPVDISMSWDVPTLWFCMHRNDVDYFIENNDYSESDFVKLTIDNMSNCEDYEAIQIGGYTKGSDISIEGNELIVSSRSDNKIVLTMTVWHQSPEYEYKIGKDYIYHLENGNLVILGKFGGYDADR